MAINLSRSFYVSSKAEFIWGATMIRESKCRVIRQSFSSDEVLYYGSEHNILGFSITVFEALNSVVTTGYQRKVIIFDFNSGQTRRIININADAMCLFKMENHLVISSNKLLSFFDMVNEVKVSESKLDNQEGNVLCMGSGLKAQGNGVTSQNVLLLGFWFSSKITEVILPDLINKNGRGCLFTGNRITLKSGKSLKIKCRFWKKKTAF
jgi:hypothetical protein